jgi:hypothetical protein
MRGGPFSLYTQNQLTYWSRRSGQNEKSIEKYVIFPHVLTFSLVVKEQLEIFETYFSDAIYIAGVLYLSLSELSVWQFRTVLSDFPNHFS